MHLRSLAISMLLVASGALFAACDGDGGGGGELPACPSGGSELTYDNFGKDFFEGYCTSCHAEGSGVNEAQDISFETQSGIQARIGDIYGEAGGSNTGMPPSGGPSASEREQLAEWLACGAK